MAVQFVSLLTKQAPAKCYTAPSRSKLQHLAKAHVAPERWYSAPAPTCTDWRSARRCHHGAACRSPGPAGAHKEREQNTEDRSQDGCCTRMWRCWYSRGGGLDMCGGQGVQHKGRSAHEADNGTMSDRSKDRVRYMYRCVTASCPLWPHLLYGTSEQAGPVREVRRGREA